MRLVLVPVAVMAFLLPGGSLAGQVAWDSPLMVGPSAPTGWGVYLSDPAPGGGIGVFTTWRTGGLYGFRLGIAEDARDDLAIFGGFDVSSGLVRVSDDFPLDVNWVAGGGFGIGDATVLSVPFGLSIGRDFFVDEILFSPYATPRVILDAYLGDDAPDDTLDLEFAVDLGFDIAFDSGWTVRFAGSIGDRESLAIGINFRVF